jgi:hypothetical protein
LRDRSGVIKPFIVVQLLVVMMLAGVGASFALDSNAVGPTPTPVPSATPTLVVKSSLEWTDYFPVYNPEMTQVIGIAVIVHNKDAAAAHSGTINVAIDLQGDTVTEVDTVPGQEYVTNLAAGATIQITVDLGPIARETYLSKLITLRLIVQ